MDYAYKVWNNRLFSLLTDKYAFYEKALYYKIPKTSFYIKDGFTFKQYLFITKEVRSGRYPFLRFCLVVINYVLTKYLRHGEKILAPASEQYFSIFLGNHRLRYTSVDYLNDLVIDLSDKKPDFNGSSLAVKNSVLAIYSPEQKIKDTPRVIEEERLSGTPINRTLFLQSDEINFIRAYLKLQSKDSYNISHSDYIADFKTKYSNFLISEGGDSNNNHHDFGFLMSQIDSLMSLAGANLKGTVKISMSHRDLNRGNVFLCEDNALKLIDWEFCGPSYYKYDAFIFVSNFRHNKSIITSWNKYKEASIELFGAVEYLDIAYFLVEEVLFFIDNYSIRPNKRESDLKDMCDSLAKGIDIFKEEYSG